MAESTKPKFTFESKAVDANTFNVVNFKGTEGLSEIYHFNILLISENTDLDIGSILQNSATLTIKRDDGDIPFNGVLSSFEQLHQAAGMVFYRAELVPGVWRTTLSHYNEIFLDKNSKDIIGQVLQKGGMKQGLNFDFKLQGSYPDRDYVCQYDESYFNFACRWMERDGMYYYFEQGDQGEKMVVTDTHISHSPMPEGTTLTYSPPSNLDHAHREEIIKNFMLKQQPLPKKVLLKDYNYRKPSLEMKAEALVSENGLGEIYIYGEHFSTIDEGQKLAKIRAEEFLCREKVFHGVSTIPYIRSGYIFEMKDHYRQDFNQRYLTISVVHEGSQEAYLVSGLGMHLADNEDRLYYRNSFSCIPANTQFRAERKTEKPKLSGTMNAKIDAAGSGKYAELDSQGRYKVILPFDESGRSQGKATAWLRMSQPYGGSNHGMHFPLHKGTEVLLTCVEGDPDRPIIQAAAPNPETPSLVKDSNQTQCVIATSGLNKIHTQDKEGSEGVHLYSPVGNTHVRLGAPDPDSPTPADPDEEKLKKLVDDEIDKKKEEETLAFSSERNIKIGGKDMFTLVKGNESKVILGFSNEAVAGNDFKAFAGGKEDIVLFLEVGLKMGGSLEFSPLHKVLHEAKSELELKVDKMSLKVNDLNLSKTDLTSDLEELRMEHDILVDQHQALKAESSVLAGQSSKLAGDVQKLSGQMSEVSGEVSNVCGEVTKLAGSETGVSGEVLYTAGSRTGTIASDTKIAAESSKISTEMNNIAALISNI